MEESTRVGKGQVWVMVLGNCEQEKQEGEPPNWLIRQRERLKFKIDATGYMSYFLTFLFSDVREKGREWGVFGVGTETEGITTC